MHDLNRRHALGCAAGLMTAAVAAPAASAAAIRTAVLIGDADRVTEAIAKGLGAQFTVITMRPVDAADGTWRTTIAKVRESHPSVSLIVNVAIPEPGGPAGNAPIAEVRRIIAASYGRTFFALKHGGELLRSAGGGLFVNVTAADGQHGAAGSMARCAAANGITVMTKSAALEFARWDPQVRVNALLVGVIAKGQNVRAGEVTPGDVAAAVSYLANDASVYLTGLILPVTNGGRSA